MEIKTLDAGTLRQLYDSHMKEDFPPSELRPYFSMKRLMESGNYRCFGYDDGTGLLAYALFAVKGSAALLDYYAVSPELRGQGVGQKFLGGLRDVSAEMGVPYVLIEVESVESAETEEEREVRRRRIRFYEHCGCRMSRVKSFLFGVEYSIMYLPLTVEAVSDGEVRDGLAGIYDLVVGQLVSGPEEFRQVCRLWAEPEA